MTSRLHLCRVFLSGYRPSDPPASACGPDPGQGCHLSHQPDPSHSPGLGSEHQRPRRYQDHACTRAIGGPAQGRPNCPRSASRSSRTSRAGEGTTPPPSVHPTLHRPRRGCWNVPTKASGPELGAAPGEHLKDLLASGDGPTFSAFPRGDAAPAHVSAHITLRQRPRDPHDPRRAPHWLCRPPSPSPTRGPRQGGIHAGMKPGGH